MLTTKIQQSIRTSYQNLHHQLDNFIPRRAQIFWSQKLLKHSVVNITLQPMIVAEAGTEDW
ncbi:hypothetical protein ACT691_09120 [Vibrio metschnikovii]